MYYGLFVRVDGAWLRVDTTRGFTLETAKREFAALAAALREHNIPFEYRKLPRVKQIDVRGPDRKYARTPW